MEQTMKPSIHGSFWANNIQTIVMHLKQDAA